MISFSVLDRSMESSLKNRNEDNSEQNQTKTSHELLHALRLTTVGIKKFSRKHCQTGTAS